ncbi:5-hydroxytryptamine receptor 1D-like [Anticarsia gemmatalis]|uniref:5-hydroxytryptamine receptor 1D-like n=1 Tax=Anticarsia gemmatalis TaxID=129554 RepID=UPI003F75A375
MQSATLYPRGGFNANWCARAAAIITLITCTVTGNTAVLLALRRTRRAPAHYPLVSLAAADLLVGLFVVPIAAVRELFVVQLHWLLCTSWETLDVLCCTASILSLCVLGWERWCGITAPLARAQRSRYARILAGLVWPVSLAVAMPTAFIYAPKHHPGETDKACPDNMNVSYVFVSATLSFYLPASVMVGLYARILSALSVPPQIRSHRGRSPWRVVSPIGKPSKNASSGCSTPLPDKTTQEQPKSPMILTPKGASLNLPEGSKRVDCAAPNKVKTGGLKSSAGGILSLQRRATQTIVRLMALFLVCWTPFFVMLPVDSICDCVWDSIWQWSTWLGYLNSALNPLVYAAASPSVRQALHASLTSSARQDIQMTTPVRRN